MNISASQFSAGLAAMQTGQQQMTDAAHNITQANSSLASADAATAAPNIDISTITEQLMLLEQAKIMGQLGAKVLSSAEASLATLIDIQS